MPEVFVKKLKDLGTQRYVTEALPYAVVRGAWYGTFDAPHDEYTMLTHIVPAGKQLKILFLRVWTQNPDGAIFSIVQTNPTEAGQTGDVEAYPVVGNAPEGVVDYPFLESAGGEVVKGSLKEPVHVLEGSIDFKVLNVEASPYYYGISWWGVEKEVE